MFTALSRIIKYGFLGFWRNGWLSTATISIMVIALLMFEGLIIFRFLTNTALEELKDKIDISIYFKQETPEDKMLSVKRALESLSEVKLAEYTSQDKALAAFKEKHKDDQDQTISQSLEQLNGNPLLASLDIKAYDPKKYQQIADYLNQADFRDSFEKVTFNQNALVIGRLNRIIDTAERGGLALIITLALVAVLVTFNTIRLAIYSSREEIGIMRLVGASNTFIRGPYVIEGIIYGIIAAVFSLIVAAPVVYFISPHINIVITQSNTWGYFLAHLPLLFLYQILFGVVLGIISSTIAISKYLKV